MSNNIDFLFGNLDKQGKLENDDQVAADLRELLESAETAQYLNNVLATSVPDLESKNDAVDGDSGMRVQPNEDAVDFTDIQELAEDIAPKPVALAPSFFRPATLPILSKKPTSSSIGAPKIQGRLKFSEVFASHVASVPQVFRTKTLPVTKDDAYDIGVNDLEIFQKPIPTRFADKENDDDFYSKEEQLAIETKKVEKLAELVPEIASDVIMASVVLEHWEENIQWDESAKATNTNALKKIDQKQMFRNEHLDDDDWTLAINWGDNTPKIAEFHLDDPSLLVLQSEATKIQEFNPENFAIYNYKKRPDGKLIDRFNISEDWKSESLNNKLIKQTHGPIKLMHSLPAVKLHPQLMKPLLPVKELRSHHRPTVKFTASDTITFSRVKAVKKKKFREVDPGEMMRAPKDLTLKDTSKYCIVEYSEEYPPIMQNIGMASLIYNYYRKKDDKDNFVPKLTNGGPFILENVDVSPFFGFGDVKSGETWQVLYNNIFRAPLFPQPTPQTDFLLIRHTYKGTTKYYLRDIPNVYTVGQILPVQEVLRPQARKVTQALKSRLQVVGYRMMRIDPYRRLQYSRLRSHFPMYTDLQIRQKLKEFACYYKKGENTGWWKLKPGLLLPDEDGIRKIWTPEMVCLQHSTLVGAQRLKDAGYGAEDMKEVEGDEENESHLDIEVQLAPWTTTKNFIASAQGKGMVQLFGPGDPTGCGEGFSYIRASMKEMFFHSVDNDQTKLVAKQTQKYSIVEQQRVYKAEIERIFNNQRKSLGKFMDGTEGKSDEIEKLKKKALEAEKAEELDRQNQMGFDSATNSPAVPNSPPVIEHEDFEMEGDVQSSIHGSALAGKSKMLVINRLMRSTTGDPIWKSEVITDSRVLNAYLRHRKLIDSPPTASSAYPNETDMKARRRRRTNAHIVKLQIKQGKKPPLNQEEDLSESELPDENIQKPPVPNLKIAVLTGQEEESFGKKRLNSLELNESSTQKVKGSPDYDLNEILGKILNRFIDDAIFSPFVLPITPEMVPDYHIRIMNPICLQQVQERISNFRYRSKQRFLEDINLLVSNCKAYNGDMSPLTANANKLALQINALVQLEIAKLNRLEMAIINQEELVEKKA